MSDFIDKKIVSLENEINNVNNKKNVLKTLKKNNLIISVVSCIMATASAVMAAVINPLILCSTALFLPIIGVATVKYINKSLQIKNSNKQIKNLQNEINLYESKKEQYLHILKAEEIRRAKNPPKVKRTKIIDVELPSINKEDELEKTL